MENEENEVEIEVGCSQCSFSFLLDPAEADFIGYDFWEDGKVLFNISQYILAPCPNCGKEWFLSYAEFLALCSEFDICSN